VEEFERKMNMLEDANNTAPGRWVLMPKKDERFMGPQERSRIRVRHRRKRVFMVLLEAAVATLLIGAAPPLHAIWLAAGVLLLVLLLYCALLVKLRAEEEVFTRRRHAPLRANERAVWPRYGAGRTRTRDEDVLEAFEAAGLHVAALAYDGDGSPPPVHDLVWDQGMRIIEEDVHVVVKRQQPARAPGVASSAR
jgi:hypothetical protein